MSASNGNGEDRKRKGDDDFNEIGEQIRPLKRNKSSCRLQFYGGGAKSETWMEPEINLDKKLQLRESVKEKTTMGFKKIFFEKTAQEPNRLLN